MQRLLGCVALAMAVPVAAQPTGPAETATRAAIARVEALNPKVNAVLALDPTAVDQARSLDRQRKARGPLFGVPVLIKDNIETRGPLPTTAGSLALKDNVTGRDAPLVAGLRAAGAVILGKTNLSEWANIRSDYSISGWSGLGGQVRNPHALDRTPCGSSSGSGAAVAAGMVDAAIGTETDGSVTCPAAINGIVGLKPTVGLVSRTHVVPISHSQDAPGPMTGDVRTAALVLGAIAGSDPADAQTAAADAHRADYVAALDAGALKGARIGVMRFTTGWSPATDAVFETALAVLKAQGAVLVDVEAPKDRRAIGAGELQVLLSELKADLNAYLATTPASVKVRTLADAIAFNAATPRETVLFGQDIFVKAEATKGLDDKAYLDARATSLKGAKDALDAMLAKNNVVALVGITAAPAWPIDAVIGDQSPGGGAGGLAAVSGYPHLTVPMGAVRGLPVGLSFIGPAWSEARLLGLGYAYEQASRAKVTPTFAASVETMPDVAAALAPPR
ncbi:amidase [Sandarakinorhabdus sp. DWP1-3-1]|uniref:amidase n=1 Tax=Sandarakinorhabdus sp. DWP1-3-1 TaxID=2804627 RepID=UPI003CF8C677